LNNNRIGTKMKNRILLVREDITKLEVDAIVNAANKSLLGGGGVDGAIHTAAGPELLEECKRLEGCKTGEAKITSGYNLPALHIIHTVGPIWYGGTKNEEEQLANCYHNSLALARENNCKTIAFPNISTGIYHFPKERAAEIAVREVKAFLDEDDTFDKVFFVCFDKENYNIYKSLI